MASNPGIDDVLELMDRVGIPRTREDYIDLTWGAPLPDPWTAEHESELPKELQDWSLFEPVDGGKQLVQRDFDESDHPRDEDGKFTFGGGGGSSEDSSDGGGSSAVAVDNEYSVATSSPHVGVSSDFDLRPGHPMPEQSSAVTVGGISSPSASYHRDIPVSINPSTSTTKHIAEENGARVLQDRAGNVFVWPADLAIHADVMDALEHVETMWASDLFEVVGGRLVSQNAPGKDTAKEWIARGQQNAKTADASSVGFVSPNVKNDLDFAGAVAAIKGEQHAALMSASAGIDRALGVKAKEASTVGAWADGAENSVMSVSGADWDHLALATMMKGYLADQKSVLIFQQGHDGDAVLASFAAKGELEAIHKNLLEDGLAFHTLVPTQGGATVYVADLDGKLVDAVKKGAERYDSKVTIQYGRAEFVGDTSGQGTDREQRDRAREIYARGIEQSPVRGSTKIWAGVRDRWSPTTQAQARRLRARAEEVLSRYSPDQPRDEDGQWSDGGGGSDGGSDSGSSGAAVSNYSPGLTKISSNKAAQAFKDERAAKSPVKTVEDLVARAPAAQDRLVSVGAPIAAKLGVEFKNPGVKAKDQKGVDRIKVKMAERGHSAARITDAARATFVITKPGQAEEIATELSKHFEVALEDWKLTEVNYLDRAMTVQMPNGVMAEIQLMDPAMANAKSAVEKGGGGGHELYDEWRAMKPSTPAEFKKYDELLSAQRKLYGDVIAGYPAEWKAELGKSGILPKSVSKSV